jgi:hypothetical protein
MVRTYWKLFFVINTRYLYSYSLCYFFIIIYKRFSGVAPRRDIVEFEIWASRQPRLVRRSKWQFRGVYCQSIFGWRV